MTATADIEIAALRRAEARESAEVDEFDRLLRLVWPHYACNFVLGSIPDRIWVDRMTGMGRVGLPPRDRKGWVVVSLGTLRELAKRLG